MNIIRLKKKDSELSIVRRIVSSLIGSNESNFDDKRIDEMKKKFSRYEYL